MPDRRSNPAPSRRRRSARSTRRPAASCRRSMSSTTFIRDPDNQYRSGYTYGRPDNATVRQAEAVIAMLEGGARGAAVRLRHGGGDRRRAGAAAGRPHRRAAGHVLGSARLADDEAPRCGYQRRSRRHDDLAALRAAIRPGSTKLVWIETPGQSALDHHRHRGRRPSIAHAAGARARASNSTAATPVFTRPLALGADIVMHSATKYLNGHSDVVAGALATARRTTRSGTRIKQRARRMHGAILGPFEAWLLMRGLRTLDLRVQRRRRARRRCSRTRFANHACVASRALSRPAAASGPRGRGAADDGGFGGMLSIRVKGGEQAAIEHRGAGRTVEARDLARRRREPDRAPRLDRRRGLALPARPAAALGRARGRGRSLRRSRSGAAGGEWVSRRVSSQSECAPGTPNPH